jgi:hypothetical protein
MDNALDARGDTHAMRLSHDTHSADEPLPRRDALSLTPSCPHEAVAISLPSQVDRPLVFSLRFRLVGTVIGQGETTTKLRVWSWGPPLARPRGRRLGVAKAESPTVPKAPLGLRLARSTPMAVSGPPPFKPPAPSGWRRRMWGFCNPGRRWLPVHMRSEARGEPHGKTDAGLPNGQGRPVEN